MCHIFTDMAPQFRYKLNSLLVASEVMLSSGSQEKIYLCPGLKSQAKIGFQILIVSLGQNEHMTFASKIQEEE